MRLLRVGDALVATGPHTRFSLIVEMNDTLEDGRATYDLFVQLVAQAPELARREAFLALPAVVEAGDFALAERYLAERLVRLDELNQLAAHFPLFPPPGQAPRLAAELSNFMRDIVLRAAVLDGTGRAIEAQSLREAALAGLQSEEICSLAQRELAIREPSRGRG